MSLVSDIWSTLAPAERRSVAAAQLVCVAMAIATVAGIAAIVPFFTALGGAHSVQSHGLLQWLFQHGHFRSRHDFIAALGVAFIAVTLVANLINAAGTLTLNRLALGIGHQLQARLFEEYLGRPYVFHTVEHSATLFDNVAYEVGRLTSGILQNAFAFIGNAITGSLIIVSVMLLNPAISLLLLLGLGGGYALIYLLVRARLLRLGRAHSHSSSERARIVNDSFASIRDILLLPDRQVFTDDFDRAGRTASESLARIQGIGQVPKHIMECAAIAALVGVALLMGARDQGTGAWLGRLSFLVFAAYRILPVLQQVFAAAVRIRADRAGFALIATDLRSARVGRDTHRGQGRQPERHWHERPRQRICLQDVSFRYAPAGPWVLERVSLDIPARATVGLVGANGAGKTTLMDLMAGLLSPTSGELQVDEISMDDDARRCWRARIAYVPQNVILLDASIARNIAFGAPPGTVDPLRLRQAARLARLDEFVATLPRGYDHVVGERGIRLSGGQRQRIAIARALYKRSSVLFLDEPTSALDGLTEAELVDTLAALRREYTIVLIAHRSSLMQLCDVVLELDERRLVERRISAPELQKHVAMRERRQPGEMYAATSEEAAASAPRVAR